MAYIVAIRYAGDVKPPKERNALAIETTHNTLGSAQIEVEASKNRPDIGEIHFINTVDISKSILYQRFDGAWTVT